ncbi:MAG: hypothetical protein Q9191_002122 [Dirinaria sp. TL-2023a]
MISVMKFDLLAEDVFGQSECAPTFTAEASVKRRENKGRSVSPSIPRFLVEAEESRALTFFVSSWVHFPHDPLTDHGITEILPHFFGDLKSSTTLYLALTAASRLLFGAWELRVRDVETLQVQMAYGKALAATRLAVEDPVESLKDETLMAVLLLALYEVRISQAVGRFLEDFTPKLTPSLGLGGSVSRAMQSNTAIDTRSTIWSDDNALPHNPATILDVRFTEVANVLALESSLLAYKYERPLDAVLPPPYSGFQGLDVELPVEGAADGSSWTTYLISRAKTVDSNLGAWLEIVPSNWLPRRVVGESVPPTIREAGMYNGYCDIYPDILVATTLNEWRAARLKLLALVARYEPDEQVTANIQRLADDICASLPFHLGDRIEMTPIYFARSLYPTPEGQPLPQGHHQNASAFGGWYLYSPLKEITNVFMYLREGQPEWVLGQMKRLAKIHDVVTED